LINGDDEQDDDDDDDDDSSKFDSSTVLDCNSVDVIDLDLVKSIMLVSL